MKTLYIERSTGSVRDGSWSSSLECDGVTRIVVGMGPGSFAGIRAALAFAQGFSTGRECEILGLPSPCAIAAKLIAEGEISAQTPLAVIGDARRGYCWIAKFQDGELDGEVKQVVSSALAAAVGASALVVSPDHTRIGTMLADIFALRYRGEALPTTDGLRLYAESFPSALCRNPLPIYLNPAVRA